MKKLVVAVMIVSLAGLTGCPQSSSDDVVPAAAPVVGSLFAHGCPIPGLAGALEVTSPFFKVEGPDGLGTVGDYLLMNNQAAFVIQGVDHNVNTYNYYAGILIDAVALHGCQQAGPERFEEAGLMLGELDIGTFTNSYLRSFRAEWVEVLNNGLDGNPAVVRVHGTDDTFWLTELELIQTFYNSFGTPTAPSAWREVDVFVDYILPADSSVLTIEFNMHNTTPTTFNMLAGMALFFGDTTSVKYAWQSQVGIPGFALDAGTFWLSTSAGDDGSWTFAYDNATMATMYVSGVSALVNADQLGTPVVLTPDGTADDTGTVRYFVAVGDGDYNTSIENLYTATNEPMPGLTYHIEPIDGYVYDLYTGEPIEGAEIEIQILNAMDVWVFLTGFQTDENGLFGGNMPAFDVPGVTYRVTTKVKGRTDPMPAYFTPGVDTHFDIGVMPEGMILYDVRDEGGRNIPCKIILWGLDNLGNPTTNIVQRWFPTEGTGVELVAPGTYWVSVTRGFEYSTYQGAITVGSGLITPLQVQLVRQVDTTGYLSTDTHIHAAPSGDNYIAIPDRIKTVAAEGVEIAISTDHENVISWQSGIDETGLGEWVATVLGEEVSAGSPGHSNIFPIESRFDINARGAPVEWWNSQVNPDYPMDVQELFATERARGAEVIQVNHPRDTGIFGTALYNRTTGVADEDPANVGQRPGAVQWDWGFDSFEYINGAKGVFIDGNPDRSGLWEDWMSFLNLGHNKTAVGASDAHNYEIVGHPRSFYPASSDSVEDFDVNELIDAMLTGKVIVSTGAFARVSINDTAGMGDVVADGDGAVDLWVHIEAIEEVDVTRFKVYINCDEAFEQPTTDPNGVVKFDGVLNVPISADSHIVILAFGDNLLPRGWESYGWDVNRVKKVPRVTTNPIFVDYDGGGYTAPGPKACFYYKHLSPP